ACARPTRFPRSCRRRPRRRSRDPDMTSLPPVGLGGAPLGGLFAPVSDDTARATVAAAVAAGWTYVDTAPLYGYGLSEARVGAIDVVLLAGCCTLLGRSAEAILLGECADRGVPVIAGGVFNSGVLANPASGTYSYRPVPTEIRRKVSAMADACARHDVPLA